MGVESPSLHSTHICNLVACCDQTSSQASLCLTLHARLISSADVISALARIRTTTLTHHDLSQPSHLVTYSHKHVGTTSLPESAKIFNCQLCRTCHIIPRVIHARYTGPNALILVYDINAVSAMHPSMHVVGYRRTHPCMSA